MRLRTGESFGALWTVHQVAQQLGIQKALGVTRQAETVLKVDNSGLSLRPGMTATAVITVNKKENALLVPNAALRFTPPATQPTAKSGGGGLVSALLPRPPGSESTLAAVADSKSKEQAVWTLRNGQLTAITITKGDTDGVVTEVTGGALEPGTELVTEAVSAKR